MTTTEDDIPENINRQLNETLGITDDDVEQEYHPIYRVYGESKIPVSEAESKLWHTRKNQCEKVMEDVTESWDLAYKYFNADQIVEKDDGNYEFRTNTKLGKTKSNSQNLVWANNIGVVPALYSQDPSIEITNRKDKDENLNQQATLVERLVNSIFTKRVAPGINIKTKVRKAILNTLLTNRGVIKIGWTFKIDGTEQAIQEINELGSQLEKAKSIKEVKEIEGKITALEEVVNYASPEGPTAKHIRPFDLFIDPNAEEQDGSDANWIMEREWIPTEYLKAKFGETDENGETKSVFKPSKVLAVGKSEEDSDDNDSNLSFNENSFETYGYDNQEGYKKSCLTECFWVWDKLKRRVYLYANNDWSFPVWVWEDPLQLEEFFPYYVLNFYENPSSTLCKGETSYYLDQQNAINMINSQLQRMREFGFNHFLFNSNSGMDIKDIQKWANGKQNIVSVNLPPNMKFEDVLFNGQLPSDKTQQLYDKSDLINVIDMITGTDATTRSGEYKTNTTNLAIQTYVAGKSIKLDDKRDAIETWLGNIGWGIAQLCLMYMSKEQVDSILGEDNDSIWQNLPADILPQIFSVRCVGGSTVKPTTDAKKQQALQLMQMLGQFASATPYALIVALEVVKRAFDESVIHEEDVEMIKQSIQQQLDAQMQAQQQQAQLANAQAEQAGAETDKNVAETQQIMSQMNGFNPELQQSTPEMLMQG